MQSLNLLVWRSMPRSTSYPYSLSCPSPCPLPNLCLFWLPKIQEIRSEFWEEELEVLQQTFVVFPNWGWECSVCSVLLLISCVCVPAYHFVLHHANYTYTCWVPPFAWLRVQRKHAYAACGTIQGNITHTSCCTPVSSYTVTLWWSIESAAAQEKPLVNTAAAPLPPSFPTPCLCSCSDSFSHGSCCCVSVNNSICWLTNWCTRHRLGGEGGLLAQTVWKRGSWVWGYSRPHRLPMLCSIFDRTRSLWSRHMQDVNWQLELPPADSRRAHTHTDTHIYLHMYLAVL